MQSHPEFFRTRSYEVVHAVFRVAGVASRESIRFALEERALGYFLRRDLESLLDLRDTITLAQEVGDIYEVNAEVLLREIGTLRDILEYRATQERADEQTHSQEEVSVADMFSEQPFSFASFERAMDDFEKNENAVVDKVDAKTESLEVDINTSGSHISEITSKTAVKPSFIRGASIYSKSPEMSLEESGNGVIEQKGEVLLGKKSGSSGNETMGVHNIHTSAERRERIISLLRTKQFCHINDILQYVSGVSDRTIRSDIKALVDNKMVERIGNGGPNSYLRLKNITNSN